MPSLKTYLKRSAPSPVKEWILRRQASANIRREFQLDAKRYNEATAKDPGPSQISRVQLEARLTKDYHRVEKGFTLPDPKRPFGREVLHRLNAMIPAATEVSPAPAYLEQSLQARDALVKWNRDGTIDSRVASELNSGAPYVPTALSDAARFFQSRHSVRHFSATPVDIELINEAIGFALNSPSVCNRAPWRVRVYTGQHVRQVLAHQNGNRGFGHNIPCLLLVTVDAGLMTGPGERNQAWIEGGIFSSSLVWSIHSIGLASCMLNLSLTNSATDKLRAETEMAERELPIAMIAVGHAADGARVTNSRRRTLDEVLRGSQ